MCALGTFKCCTRVVSGVPYALVTKAYTREVTKHVTKAYRHCHCAGAYESVGVSLSWSDPEVLLQIVGRNERNGVSEKQ